MAAERSPAAVLAVEAHAPRMSKKITVKNLFTCLCFGWLTHRATRLTVLFTSSEFSP